MENITLEQLDNPGKEDYIIYIGRQDCLDCRLAKDKIQKGMERQPIRVFYYDTDLDREKNRENMDRVLEKYRVTAVPAVVFVRDGEGYETIYCDEILSSFDSYIHNYKVLGDYFNREIRVLNSLCPQRRGNENPQWRFSRICGEIFLGLPSLR